MEPAEKERRGSWFPLSEKKTHTRRRSSGVTVETVLTRRDSNFSPENEEEERSRIAIARSLIGFIRLYNE